MTDRSSGDRAPGRVERERDRRWISGSLDPPIGRSHARRCNRRPQPVTISVNLCDAEVDARPAGADDRSYWMLAVIHAAVPAASRQRATQAVGVRTMDRRRPVSANDDPFAAHPFRVRPREAEPTEAPRGDPRSARSSFVEGRRAVLDRRRAGRSRHRRRPRGSSDRRSSQQRPVTTMWNRRAGVQRHRAPRPDSAVE